MPESSTLILILNWMKADDTLDCLRSLQAADLSDADVLVLDNGSTNDSVTRLKAAFPQVHLIENKANLGFAGGNNVGIRYAIEHGYEFVFFLNSDTVVQPDFLAPLVAAMRADVQLGAAQSLLLKFQDRTKIDTLGQTIYAHGFALDEDSDSLKPDCMEPREIFGACAAAALYRTEVLEPWGGFDESFFVIYEDVDLSWKTRLAGYTARLIPASVVYHKRGVSGSKGNRLADFYFNRNLLFLSARYLPTHDIIRYFPLFMYRFWKVFYYACLLGRTTEYLSLLGQSIHQRRSLQASAAWRITVERWLQPVSFNYADKVRQRLTGVGADEY